MPNAGTAGQRAEFDVEIQQRAVHVVEPLQDNGKAAIEQEIARPGGRVQRSLTRQVSVLMMSGNEKKLRDQ